MTESQFTPEVTDPWVDLELGVRVHDEFLHIAHYTGEDALWSLLIEDYCRNNP